MLPVVIFGIFENTKTFMLPVVIFGVFKSILGDPLGGLFGDEFNALGHPIHNHVLDARVLALRVLAYSHNVNVLENCRVTCRETSISKL